MTWEMSRLCVQQKLQMNDVQLVQIRSFSQKDNAEKNLVEGH